MRVYDLPNFNSTNVSYKVLSFQCMNSTCGEYYIAKVGNTTDNSTYYIEVTDGNLFKRLERIKNGLIANPNNTTIKRRFCIKNEIINNNSFLQIEGENIIIELI